MQATEQQIFRTAHEWENIAGDTVTVEQIGAAIYGFTSEIGALRLFRKFNGAGRADYSKNLNTWFFSVELNS